MGSTRQPQVEQLENQLRAKGGVAAKPSSGGTGGMGRSGIMVSNGSYWFVWVNTYKNNYEFNDYHTFW